MTRKQLVCFLTDNFDESEEVGIYIEDIYGAPIEVLDYTCNVRMITNRCNISKSVIENMFTPGFKSQKPIEVKAMEIVY